MDQRLSAMLGIVFVCFVGGAGCSPSTLSANWGTAYNQAKQGQILNPEAGNSQEPVVGIDGHAAATTMDIYRKSFEKSEQDMGQSIVSSGVKTR